MEMPFGKHEGEEVEDLPDGYLKWLAHNVDMWDDLREAVDAEMEARGFD